MDTSPSSSSSSSSSSSPHPWTTTLPSLSIVYPTYSTIKGMRSKTGREYLFLPKSFWEDPSFPRTSMHNCLPRGPLKDTILHSKVPSILFILSFSFSFSYTFPSRSRSPFLLLSLLLLLFCLLSPLPHSPSFIS
jgi:hypothetical protein